MVQFESKETDILSKVSILSSASNMKIAPKWGKNLQTGVLVNQEDDEPESNQYFVLGFFVKDDDRGDPLRAILIPREVCKNDVNEMEVQEWQKVLIFLSTRHLIPIASSENFPHVEKAFDAAVAASLCDSNADSRDVPVAEESHRRSKRCKTTYRRATQEVPVPKKKRRISSAEKKKTIERKCTPKERAYVTPQKAKKCTEASEILSLKRQLNLAKAREVKAARKNHEDIHTSPSVSSPNHFAVSDNQRKPYVSLAEKGEPKLDSLLGYNLQSHRNLLELQVLLHNQQQSSNDQRFNNILQGLLVTSQTHHNQQQQTIANVLQATLSKP